jgi:TIR domain
MKNDFDKFISYANEDEKLATEIACALKSNGFNLWYAPINLKIGEKLFNSIEDGISKLKAAILLISQDYLKLKIGK